MSRSPHPLLDDLFRSAGAPAQLLEQARSVQARLDRLTGVLERVGFEAVDPWAALLAAPFASAGASGGVQAALDQLAAAAPAPHPTPDAAARPRSRAAAPLNAAGASVTSRDAVRRRDAGAAVAPTGAAGWSAAAAAPARPATVKGISARAAAATWQQRAAEANLQAAFAAPLRAPAPAARPDPAPGLAAPSNPARDLGLPRSPARPAALAAADRLFAEPRVASELPVQQRLSAVLARLEPGRAAAPAAVERFAVPHRRPLAEIAEASPPPGATGAALPRAPAAAWPAAPSREALPEIRRAVAAEATPALPSGGGLRGLAARAAVGQAASPNGAPRSSAALPAPAADASATPLSDEHLLEQIARLLKREAQRDGIDVSDVSP